VAAVIQTPKFHRFFVGTSDTLTNTAGTMIAYCFNSVEGYSKFGSYTGNGSADGPFVYTGFRPALGDGEEDGCTSKLDALMIQH
jgi:hypothetical protein